MKDPFEAALEEQQQSPPESPAPPDDEPLEDDAEVVVPQPPSSASTPIPSSFSSAAATAGGGGGGVGGGPVGRGKEEEEDEDEEENMDVELGRITCSSGDPDKMAKMQAILSQFTEEQMSRYESFRRSGFQKSNMKRLLVSITGNQKISVPMTIVVSGIAKMFVGELVENGFDEQ